MNSAKLIIIIKKIAINALEKLSLFREPSLFVYSCFFLFIYICNYKFIIYKICAKENFYLMSCDIVLHIPHALHLEQIY